jgi:hypothetical protein
MASETKSKQWAGKRDPCLFHQHRNEIQCILNSQQLPKYAISTWLSKSLRSLPVFRLKSLAWPAQGRRFCAASFSKLSILVFSIGFEHSRTCPHIEQYFGIASSQAQPTLALPLSPTLLLESVPFALVRVPWKLDKPPRRGSQVPGSPASRRIQRPAVRQFREIQALALQ